MRTKSFEKTHTYVDEDSVLQTRGLTLGYGGKSIVTDIQLSIPRGKISVIIGPNGCGKSTVLKSLGQLLPPMDGTVYLNGRNLAEIPVRELARQLAMLPQSPSAPPGLLVGELVSYGRYAHTRGMKRFSAEDKNIISWALEHTRLSDLEFAEVDALSGGQRQRAWIAMALAQNTDILLLDEPTTYLDMAFQLEVLELLKELNATRKYSILMVLHDINLASRYADYIIAMRDGAIVHSGSPEDIMVPQVLRDTFHIEAEIQREGTNGRPICLSYELRGSNASM